MKTAVIELRIGEDAVDKFREAMTGNDNDVLLSVENAIKEKLGVTRAGDPYVDPDGVFVDEFEVTS